MEILDGVERIFFLGLGTKGISSLGGVLFCAKCVAIVDGFVLENADSKLELAMPVPVKATESFLIKQKKIGTTISLEAKRQ